MKHYDQNIAKEHLNEDKIEKRKSWITNKILSLMKV